MLGPIVPENLAKRHNTPSQSAEQIGAAWAQRFERYCNIDGRTRILDIGSGPGRMAIAIGERYQFSNRYIGFEINRDDVQFCRREISSKFPNFTFEHADLRNEEYNPTGAIEPAAYSFPCPDSTTDFAFATSVFTHMFCDETANYMREAHRVLASGGTFLSTWFCIDEVARIGIETGAARFSFKHRRADNSLVEYPDRPGKAVGYERAHAEQMLLDAGFSSVAFYRGCWSGHEGSAIKHSQDVILARVV